MSDAAAGGTPGTGGGTGGARILICANATWNLANYRAGLIRALLADGHEVVAAAPPDASLGRVEALGCRTAPLRMSRHGTSPLGESRVLLRYLGLMARERPDIVLSFTVKPNLYGALAARAVGAAAIVNVSGLGAVFGEDGRLRRVVERLYRAALGRAHTVFFQNGEDRALFEREGIVRAGQAGLLPGSGVDLKRFAPCACKPAGEGGAGGDTILFVGRLLWDKGVGVFAQAARAIKAEHPGTRFQLLGPFEEGEGAVPRDAVAAWEREGLLAYLGEAQDVRPFIAAAHCVVLPSCYAEGTPRALIEAAAMGRPVVTTDRPGCRDTVEDGVSGYLVPPGAPDALAAALGTFLALAPAERAAMGAAGRRLAEARFDEAIVIGAYRAAIADALKARGRSR